MDEEEAEVLNNLFALAFTGNLSSDTSPVDGTAGQGLREERPSHSERRAGLRPREEPVRESISDEIHPRVLRELANEVAKPLSTSYLKSHGNQVKSCVTGKRKTLHRFFKG